MAKGKQAELAHIRRELRKLAFGRANDCVKLALGQAVDIETLDLSLLSEIKRGAGGAVEVKLMDRIKALEQLAELAQEGDEKAEEFLQALITGAQADG